MATILYNSIIVEVYLSLVILILGLLPSDYNNRPVQQLFRNASYNKLIVNQLATANLEFGTYSLREATRSNGDYTEIMEI